MVETLREAAGRAAATQECMERRLDDRKAALFDLAPQGVRAARQHQAVIEPSEFAAALRKVMHEAKDIELLFAIWEQNVENYARFEQESEARLLAQVGDCARVSGSPEAMRHRTYEARKSRQRRIG